MDTPDKTPKKPINRMNRNELLKELSRLKKEMAEEKQVKAGSVDTTEISKLEAERDEWMEKAMEREEELNKQEAYRKEFEEKSKKELKSKNKLIQKKDRQISELEEKMRTEADETETSLDSPHKSSFRLDIYKQGVGEVNGRIEHLLSRQKRKFQALDKEVIFDFIQQHIAHFLTEESDPAKPSGKGGSKARNIQTKEVLEAKTEETAVPIFLGDLFVREQGSDNWTSQLQRNMNAEVFINLDAEDQELDFSQLDWEARLSAKSLKERAAPVDLGKFSGHRLLGKNLSLNLFFQTLSPGPYRINAELLLKNRDKNLKNHTMQYDSSAVIYVY